MRRRPRSSTRVLPDGTPLQNRLLAALPAADYDRIAKHLRLESTAVGDTLHEDGRRIDDVYFPNGGVFSITNRMRDGELVEVATVGREGMLGDRRVLGRSLRRRAHLPAGARRSGGRAGGRRFLKETATAGTFREMMALYAQATLLQTMQCTACNALHDVSQRCCRWLLEIHDRVDADDFPLKQEFLAVMLGVRRPTVTDVLRALKETGLISTRYGRIRVLKRRRSKQRRVNVTRRSARQFARLGL